MPSSSLTIRMLTSRPALPRGGAERTYRPPRAAHVVARVTVEFPDISAPRRGIGQGIEAGTQPGVRFPWLRLHRAFAPIDASIRLVEIRRESRSLIQIRPKLERFEVLELSTECVDLFVGGAAR